MAPDHVTRRLLTAFLFVVLVVTGCSRQQAPTPAPLPTATPAIPTIDPNAAEDQFAAQFRVTLDLFSSASSAFNSIRSQVRRDPNLITDPAWRESAYNAVYLIQRGIDNENATPTHPAYAAATDALRSAATTYAAAVQEIVAALEQNNVDAFLAAEDTLDQAEDQRRVASSFYFAER